MKLRFPRQSRTRYCRWIGRRLGHSKSVRRAGAPGNRGSPERQEHEEDDNPAEARRRWLRALSVLSTLLAIAWSMRWAATASAADATEQAVLAAHEKRRDATLAGDAAAVGSMMTDDLTFTHANAVVETKAEFLDALKIRGINTSRSPTRNAGCASTATPNRLRDVSHCRDRDRERHRYPCAFHRAVGEGGGAWQMVLWHATNVP